MRVMRSTNWLWIMLLLGASALLYHTSYQVQELQHRISKIEVERAAELENIRVLEAEWAYLAAPERLQRLAAKYLPLKPVTTAQIIGPQAIEAALPRHETEIADAASSPASALSSGKRLLAAAGDR
ncbi:MAG: hypothetical protein WDO70_07615 [Alphaproteobacteria bacterium]